MFYAVKKPTGISSNLVAKILKRVLCVEKIGFTGTLDPLASGLMIIGTNGTPRLFPMMEYMSKTYQTTLRLDGTTTSYDLEQPVIPSVLSQKHITTITDDVIRAILLKFFTGHIEQVPPQYSAVWVNGRRAYNLARSGQIAELKSKQREIFSIEILSYIWPRLILKLCVSHGTYIRSIARDLGEKLGTGGYLETLERTGIGHIHIDKIAQWTIHNDIAYAPLKHEDIFPDISVISLGEKEKGHLRLGSTPLPTDKKNGHYFVTYDGGLFGLLEAKDGLLFPLKNNV